MEQSDLNAAHLFVQVVERGSFTSAARAVGLPKSTLSRKIGELEARLGARLLQRTTRKLSLTDLGAAYFERVHRIVSDLGEAEAAVQDAQSTPRGVLRVTAPPDLGMVFLPHAVPEFTEKYPEVEVVLDLSGRRLDLVAEGFDVALRAGHIGDSSLIVKVVATCSMGLYASPEYLKVRGVPTKLDELSSHACLVFGTVPERKWQFQQGGRPHEVAVRGRVAAQDFGYLRLAALAGSGIALLPSMLVGPDLHHGRLQVLLPEYAHAADHLYVAYPSRAFLPAKTRAFVDFITERFGVWQGMCTRAVAQCPGAPQCPGA
jgi:DNA-binding transcriptional LysR family regulator